MIKQNIMDGSEKSKYIAVYFEGITVPETLQCISKKLPDAMTSIFEQLLNVEPFSVSSESSLPVRNDVILDDHSIPELKTCIVNFLRNSHEKCCSASCKKVCRLAK